MPTDSTQYPLRVYEACEGTSAQDATASVLITTREESAALEVVGLVERLRRRGALVEALHGGRYAFVRPVDADLEVAADDAAAVLRAGYELRVVVRQPSESGSEEPPSETDLVVGRTGARTVPTPDPAAVEDQPEETPPVEEEEPVEDEQLVEPAVVETPRVIGRVQ